MLDFLKAIKGSDLTSVERDLFNACEKRAKSGKQISAPDMYPIKRRYSNAIVDNLSQTIKILLPIQKGECLHCDMESDNLVGGLCLDCRSKGVPFPDEFDLLNKIEEKE